MVARFSIRVAGFVLTTILLTTRPLTALDRGVDQLILAIAPAWNSSQGALQVFKRSGSSWRAAGAPIRVLFGTNGLAWGRGVLGTNEAGPKKVERDKRTPAGLFAIGTIYTYDPALPEGADYPFHTIGPGDAWIDDPLNPLYNRHVVVDPANPPPWFEKQKMRLNDPPHRWLVEIRHNSDPPVPGAGSAIFFHIQRGNDRTTSGCTVMSAGNLRTLIRQLSRTGRPHYAVLPRAEYLRLWKPWGLPSPKEAEGLISLVAGG